MCFYCGVKVNFGSLWEAVSYFNQLAKKVFQGAEEENGVSSKNHILHC